MRSILTGLGLTLISKDAESWTFAVPSWRFDIAIEEDLVEELARIFGYDNLPVTEPLSRFSLKPQVEAKSWLAAIRERLTALGYQEVITYSFVDKSWSCFWGQRNGSAAIGKSHIPGYVCHAHQPLARLAWQPCSIIIDVSKIRVRIFESGLVFTNKNNKIEQKPKVASILWGSQFPEQWGEQGTLSISSYERRSGIFVRPDTGRTGAFLLSRILIQHCSQGRSARVSVEEKTIGWLGALLSAQQHIDINGKVYLMELDLESVAEASCPFTRSCLASRQYAVTWRNRRCRQETGEIQLLSRKGGGTAL